MLWFFRNQDNLLWQVEGPSTFELERYYTCVWRREWLGVGKEAYGKGGVLESISGGPKDVGLM